MIWTWIHPPFPIPIPRRPGARDATGGALINAAITEFAARGFDGASTRRMAEAADAHQSQIKYHFDTKDNLWRRCIELLLDELDTAILQNLDNSSIDPRAVFEATIRGLVQFMARRPQLNRIMMHEATATTERLIWLVETQIAHRHASLTAAWQELVTNEVVAPIDVDLMYHTIIGAAALIYANAPEAVLMGIDPSDPDLIKRHADALVMLFLRPATPGGTQ